MGAFLAKMWHNRRVGLKQQTRHQEIGMAKVCPITGKRPMAGNKVSHANNKTRRRWEPNLQWKRIWVPSEKKFVRMRVSARGLRTINKMGVEKALLAAKG
jgi:large subunit ribosomal protein L28